MKKNGCRIIPGVISIWKSKVLKTMRLTVLALLIGVIQSFALDSYAQVTKLNLSGKNTTVRQVLTQIEDQSEFFFLYNSKLVDVDRQVDVNVHDQKIDVVLNQLFAGTETVYQIVDRHIVLAHSEVPVNLPSVQQRNTVSGKVTSTSGEPLPGVTVLIPGTTTGTITDFNGNYTLEIGSATQLIFSFVGMKQVTLDVAGRTTINLSMEEDAIALNEVVAIGYGTQTRREISGSVANISEKNFNKGVTQNAVDLLKGKVAGLAITQGSGDITRDQTLRLRGTSSLTGSSQPFIVIDGVPGMSLNSVAPHDIESISVLKDASAAAIYGSRSASGVILVTTKKGKRDLSLVEYDGYVAMSTVTNIPQVLNAAEWRDYASKNNINVTGLDKGANTDWFDEIMRTGVSQNHSFSMSGGGRNNSYRASLSYLGQEGVVKDNQLERYNARVTFNQKALNDMLDLTFTSSMTMRDFSPTDTRNFVLAYNMIPVVPVKNADGTWFDSLEYDQGNPVRNIEYNKRRNKGSIFFGNMKADLNLFEGFTAGINLLKQRSSNDYGLYYDSQTERGRNDLGFAERSNWTNDKNLFETTLNYRKQIQSHTLNVLAGYSYEENYYQSARGRNRQFVTNFFGYNNLEAGENLRAGDVWSGANMNKLISFFGRVNYSYLDKYIVTASLRQDGSSKFGDNHKWAMFPSISAAWRINEESFLKGADYIDDLKLRVGYGVSGNQDGIDPYQSLQLYGAAGQYYDNGKWYRAYQISQNANPNLKWEETAMFNVGIDYSFLNSRISGTIEYYDKQTNDLLYTYAVPVPPYLHSTMLANVGSMSNKGIEFLVSGDIIRNNNLRWTSSINLAHNKNKITSLSNEEFITSRILTGSAWIRGGSDNTTHIVEEGREVGTFYGWRSMGLDENGKYIMDDMVDGKPGLTNDDRTYIGSAQPKLNYGFSNIITWKNWELNFFLRGVYGNDLLNFSKMSYATTQWLPGANVLKEALTNGLTDNPKYASYYIEKGSFLRMDNASIGYTFDVSRVKEIQKLRVYVTGQNLFTITNYTGLDPEVEMSGLDPGVEGREYYPKSRTISVGVNISF
jgi:TonB-dependent starch-binding outer membrane protein SusC